MSDEQLQASTPQLEDLDMNNPLHKLLVGLFGRLNATLFSSIADLIDELDGLDMSATDKRLSRNHRLRVAAIKGDDAAIEAIMKEMADERQNGK